MKKGMAALGFALVAFASTAGVSMQRIDPAPIHQETYEERIIRENAEAADRYKYFIPRDPWRVMSERVFIGSRYTNLLETNYAKGIVWNQFAGTVLEKRTNGIVMKGWLGKPQDFNSGYHEAMFFVMHFPHDVRVGAELSTGAKFCAKRVDDKYSPFEPAIPTVDYGTPCPTPGTTPTPSPVAKSNYQVPGKIYVPTTAQNGGPVSPIVKQ